MHICGPEIYCVWFGCIGVIRRDSKFDKNCCRVLRGIESATSNEQVAIIWHLFACIYFFSGMSGVNIIANLWSRPSIFIRLWRNVILCESTLNSIAILMVSYVMCVKLFNLGWLYHSKTTCLDLFSERSPKLWPFFNSFSPGRART